jgi:hypothetical protein
MQPDNAFARKIPQVLRSQCFRTMEGLLCDPAPDKTLIILTLNMYGVSNIIEHGQVLVVMAAARG